MAKYLIEVYAPRGSTRDGERLTTAAATTAFRLRHLQTIVLPTEELGFLLVEAQSLDAVAEIVDAAGVKPERIVEAVTEWCRRDV